MKSCDKESIMRKIVFLSVFSFIALVTALWGDKKDYKVGDTGTGGGIVFYVDKAGFTVYDGMGGEKICHYLEMSKDTLGESQWFPEYVEVSGTWDRIGSGKSNTYKILCERTSKPLTEENCAAYRCSRYRTASTKAGEWFLPSEIELRYMYYNQKEQVLLTCNDTCHWASNKDYANLVWVMDFSIRDYPDNIHDNRNKHSVRAVRAF